MGLNRRKNLLHQQALCSFDPLFQAVLETFILAAAFDMSCSRRPDCFGYGEKTFWRSLIQS
jgi:hypothetical protein